MTFSPKMMVAVRVLNLLTRDGAGGRWCREPVLRRLHGMHRNTLRALELRGVVERRVATEGDYAGRWVCRLTPLAIAIIESVRA